MAHPIDFLLVLVVLMNFVVLGTSWMRVCIRAVAVQGALLGVLPLLAHGQTTWHADLMAVAAIVLKGVLIPQLLLKAMRDVRIRQEVEPVVGFVPSLVLGAAGTGFAVWLSVRLPLSPAHTGTLLVPASLATIFAGFLVLTGRRKAITQVVGYLMLDNGVFLFGLLLINAMPFLVEAGVLLDLLVAIFIMGIVLHHIRQEFSSLDTGRLAGLRD